MKKSLLVPLLYKLGIRPSRKLGQNFLTDPNLLQSIARSINPQPAELIVEIGAGIGNLTDLLIPYNPYLIAIEYDARLADHLRTKYKNFPTVHLVQADAARVDYEELAEGNIYRCIGNLPYSSSSVIIAKILQSSNKPRSMHLLLQKEMAQRLQAQTGSPSYGSLSVRIQVLYEVTIQKFIAPKLFWPAPKVDSALILLKLKEECPNAELYQHLTRLVGLSFSHRRKKMFSNLQTHYDPEALALILQKLNIKESVRPENLTPDQYVALSKQYKVMEMNSNSQR